MKIIFIYFISGAIIAIISFLIYQILSSSLEKEKKIAEEFTKKDNRNELIDERIKRNKKHIISMAICFYFTLAIISFIIILIK